MTKVYNKKTIAVNEVTTGDKVQSEFRYKGFSSFNPSRNFKLYDIELVKQDIINHFYIRKGEKLNNPEFGTQIWDLLFEPFTGQVKQAILDDVQTVINYDPRIEIESIAVDATDNGIRVEALVIYRPFNIAEQMQFTFDRNNSIVI